MTDPSTDRPARRMADLSDRRATGSPRPDDRRPARFMVIVAHPDDADFGPAATAARWIDAGSAGLNEPHPRPESRNTVPSVSMTRSTRPNPPLRPTTAA